MKVQYLTNIYDLTYDHLVKLVYALPTDQFNQSKIITFFAS